MYSLPPRARARTVGSVVGFNSWRPNPVADADGDIHLAYNTYEGPGEQAVYYSVFTGGCDDGVSLGTGAQDFPDLDLDPNGRLHAVWNGNGPIYYRVGDAGTGEWPESAVQVSTNESSSHPWVAADDAGYAHIVWAGGDDAGPIWYCKIRWEDL